MPRKKKVIVEEQQVVQTPEVPVQVNLDESRYKTVHNRNTYKVELVVEGRVVILLPGKSVQVPKDYNVPVNMGLYVRR